MRILATFFAFSVLIASPVPAETYTDVTGMAGVSYTQHTLNDPPNCLLFAGAFCQAERMSGAAAAGDADGDGHVDLYVTRLEAHDLLFRNKGDGTFEDFTATAGLDAWVFDSNGAAWIDVEKDGDLDLYVSSFGSGRYHLFVNDGAGHFSEDAVARGVALDTGDTHIGYSVAVGDYDRDGWPDLVVGEWRSIPLVLDPTKSHTRLLRNRGFAAPGHFEDTTIAAGVDVTSFFTNESFVFSPALVDLDGDGFQDLALASDFGTSLLFWNDGDGTFTEDTAGAMVGTDENGMGSAFGDFDGDGDLDWFVTSIYDPGNSCGWCNWGTTGNRLYRYDGSRSFSDATDLAGVRDGYWGWGTVFLESDNDGDLDLVMTNGVDMPEAILADPTVDDPWEVDPLRFWRNDGSGNMTEDSVAMGLTDTGSGKGLISFDYDEDGDLDVLVVNNGTGARLYRNDGGNANDWLQVEVRGRKSTTGGWGTRIEVETTDTSDPQLRVIGARSHFLGQSERIAHFGLGAPSATPVHRVVVHFPSGAQVELTDVARNRRLYVDEASTAPAMGPVPSGLLALALLISAAGYRGRCSAAAPLGSGS